MQPPSSLTVLMAFSFGCGFAGAWLMARMGSAWGLADEPTGRSSHDAAIPAAGGVGIVAVMGVVGFLLERPFWFWGIPLLLGVIGFCDDRRELSVRLRLGAQFALAAAWLLLSRPEAVFTLPFAAAALFWLFFIVASANFFNFMDGIDGIAGICGAVAFALLALFAIGRFLLPQALFCLGVCAACLGFLPFNLPRARVFMGDAASIPLGFVFAAMVFDMARSPADLLCMASFLFPFYADALSTLYVRRRLGQRLTEAHRLHLYQLLANEEGISHAKIAISYGAVQLLGALAMFLLYGLGLTWQLLLLSLLTYAFLLLSFKVRSASHGRLKEIL